MAGSYILGTANISKFEPKIFEEFSVEGVQPGVARLPEEIPEDSY